MYFVLQLSTKRLSLRPLAAADHEVFHRIITDPFVREKLCDGEALPKDQTAGFIFDSERTFAKHGCRPWLIAIAESGEIAGFAGWGFATEAAGRIVGYAFSGLGFDHIDASCDVPNTASHRVAERLGMTRTDQVEKDGVPLVISDWSANDKSNSPRH